jgi:hypothetical protein
LENKGHFVPHLRGTLGDHDPICGQQPTDVIEQRRPGFDVPLADAVEGLHILLGYRLDWHAAHPRTPDGFVANFAQEVMKGQ